MHTIGICGQVLINTLNQYPWLILDAQFANDLVNTIDQLKECLDKSPKWLLIKCLILLANCLTKHIKENCTLHQKSLEALFHTPLQLLIDWLIVDWSNANNWHVDYWDVNRVLIGCKLLIRMLFECWSRVLIDTPLGCL